MGSVCALALAGSAMAQSRSFDVPAGDLKAGLDAYIRQSGVQLIYRVDDVRGKTTKGVHGALSPDEALNQLLAGSGFKVNHDSSGAEVLVKAQANAPDAKPAGGVIRQSAAPVAASSSQEATIVVVTGSHVIRDGSKAPSPTTVVSAEELEATTPTTIADGLVKLPVFMDSNLPGIPSDGRRNDGSTSLNIHALGSNRTLILLDGMRMAPTNADGSVSIDTIPTELLQRVDTVAGGASAVYGSEAVAGVVNFVLNTKFTGLKINAQTGISKYDDVPSTKFGAAWGTNLFEGRGHLMVSGEFYKRGALQVWDRPDGPEVVLLTGSGTSSKPYVISYDVRRSDSSFGGKVQTCGGTAASCPALNEQFVSDGVLGAFNAGTVTTTSGQNIGGDGAYSPYSTALVSQNRLAFFSRFDYQLSDTVNAFAMLSVSKSTAVGWHFPDKLTPAASSTLTTLSTGTLSSATVGAAVFFKNNPFLSPSVMTALGNTNTNTATNTFSLGTYLTGFGRDGTAGTSGENAYVNFLTGLNGRAGKFDWNVYLGRGQSDQTTISYNNVNYQKQFAAMDAVKASDGTIKCYAATQAATAAEYANCVPLNAFGPTAITPAMFKYFTQDTQYVLTNRMDSLGFDVAGDVIQAPAGPIRVGVSGEARWTALILDGVGTDAAAKVDCTGLRLCSVNTPLWAAPVLPSMSKSTNVWELAVEAEIPLLKDVVLAKSLSVNLAGRHTDYALTGPVNTWKAGAVWDVFDGLRFRTAASLDIRAPTLYDLYAPQAITVGSVTDVVTGQNQVANTYAQGNPNLVPEQARSFTGGMVVQPTLLPGFMFSADYYDVHMKNELSTINGATTAIQNICKTSGFTSPYCSLIIRVNNTTYPTAFLSENINAASTHISGWDLEARYHRGPFNLRVFGSYQPTNETLSYPGASPADRIAPEWRITTQAGYTGRKWAINLQNTWFSAFDHDPALYTTYHVMGFNTTDLSVQYSLDTSYAGRLTPFINIQNLFNKQPQVFPIVTGIGIQYPTYPGYDIVGRYVTMGVKAKF